MSQTPENNGYTVKVEDLCKVYATDRKIVKKALKMAEEGVSRKEIKDKTGAVLGVYKASFEVHPGEVFVIMGLSGSGKSTLLRCVNRLIRSDQGSIHVNCGDEIVDVATCDFKNMRRIRRDRISMVFQSFAVLPTRSVLKNVEFGLENQGVEKKKRKEIALNSLELVGLEDWADQYPEELSGGMKQRIGLARALATGADLLLMDEPFSALDPLIRIHLQNEFLEIQKKLKRSSIFVTHDLKEALKIGERIAIMQDGVFVQVGTPEQIIINPKTEYVRDFVEHADPTPVVSVKRIVKKLGKIARTGEIDEAEKSMELRHRRGRIKLKVGPGRDIQCHINDTPLSIVGYHKIDRVNAEDLRSIIVKIDDETPMIDAIRARAKSKYPLLVFSGKDPIGFLRSRDLLSGILNKGREVTGLEPGVRV